MLWLLFKKYDFFLGLLSFSVEKKTEKWIKIWDFHMQTGG